MKIKWKLILYLVIVIVFFNFGFGLFLVKNERSVATKRLMAKIKNINRLVQNITREPMWDLNDKEVKKTLNIFFQDPEIRSIRLADYANTFLVRLEKTSEEGPGKNLKYELVVKKGKYKLAKAYITYTTSVLEREIAVKTKELLFLTIGLVFFTVLAIYFVSKFILKPIDYIVYGLKQVDNGNFESRLQLGTKDEFKEIEVFFNRMILAIKREMDTRSLKEKELLRLRNLMANIINSMPSTLIGVDKELKVTHWNTEAEKETGISQEAALGRDLFSVLPKIGCEIEKVKKAIEEGKANKDTKVVNRADGNTRFSDIAIYPLISDGTQGAVIRIDDITERIKIEDMMIQTEKMISVGGLAAGMAHEINNPLAGILQNVQVMRNRMFMDLPQNMAAAKDCGTNFEVIKQYMAKRQLATMMDAVMDAGQRAAKIVANMLAFSRRNDSEFTGHDICLLLDETIDLARNDYNLKKKYDFKQIKIVREYQAPMPEVKCESGMIQQVFLNILKNAAQAMAGNQIKPCLFLGISHKNEMARIEIADNGPGIDPKTRARIFEPFFTTKQVSVGTGLGLSVSYFIITEQHKGKIEVESAPEAGSRFIISLPLWTGV